MLVYVHGERAKLVEVGQRAEVPAYPAVTKIQNAYVQTEVLQLGTGDGDDWQGL
jgi:hypothetical protein